MTAAGIAAKLEAARAAYLAGDWDALERALDIVDAPAGRPVPVADLVRQSPILDGPVGVDCESCGATIDECNKAIRESFADRSCCPRCKNTDTHQLSNRHRIRRG